MDDKGWFGTVVESVIKAFHSFIGAFKKNGIVYTLFVLLIFVLFWSLVINPLHLNDIIEKRLQIQFEKQQEKQKQTLLESEQKRSNADELIIPIIEDVTERFDLNRCMMLELHNTAQNISGVDWLYFSCSYEAIGQGKNIDFVGDMFQRQYLANSLGNDLIKKLRYKEFVYYPDLSEYSEGRRFIKKLGQLGCKNAMLLPITNNNGRVIILLVMVGKTDIDAQQIYDYMKPFLTQIHNALII